jgi:cell division protein FtsL
MLKLLLCLLSATAISVVLLELRQQRLELNYQTNKLHSQIEKSQSKLWNQQLQIAMFTAPNAIAKTVGEQELKMVPQSPLPALKTNWIDPANDPNAE